MIAALKDAADALDAIATSLARVDADTQHIEAERAAHVAELQRAEAVERENSLRARRGDVDAQKLLDAAVASRRDAEAGVRQCDFALIELTDERAEYEQQKHVVDRAHRVAQRAELAEERLQIAKDIDARFGELLPLLEKWHELFATITRQTKGLGEPEGRQVHHVTEELLATYLKTFCPSLFRQEDVLRHSCFSGLSLRFTSAWPDAIKE